MNQNDSILERLSPLDQIPKLMNRQERFKFDPNYKKTLGLLVVTFHLWLTDAVCYAIWLSKQYVSYFSFGACKYFKSVRVVLLVYCFIKNLTLIFSSHPSSIKMSPNQIS